MRIELGEIGEVELDDFPVSEDFIVDISPAISDVRLNYRAPSIGLSVEFPWWNHGVDEMSRWGPGDFPCGSPRDPFWDRDQGWNLLIWRVDDLVYVAEGDGELDVYARWFAVPAELYRGGWERAIAKLRHDAG